MVSRAITLNGGSRLETPANAYPGEDEGKSMIRFKVNGVERSFDGGPKMPVLWYLRDICSEMR